MRYGVCFGVTDHKSWGKKLNDVPSLRAGVKIKQTNTQTADETTTPGNRRREKTTAIFIKLNADAESAVKAPSRPN